MKKSYSLFSYFVLALVLFIFCYKPVKAAEPTVINLSDLTDDQTLEIQEDSILNLDTDKRLKQINMNGYELTISGSGTVEIDSVKFLDSGKMIVNTGSVKYNCTVYVSGSLVVNGGSFILPRNFGMQYKNVTINGGYITGHDIHTDTDSDSYISINGGHIELKDYIDSPNIYIGDKMFVVEPWNKEPEPLRYPSGQTVMTIGANGHGVKVIPKSEVIFLDESH